MNQPISHSRPSGRFPSAAAADAMRRTAAERAAADAAQAAAKAAQINWPVWLTSTHVRLWEAAALVAGIEPQAVAQADARQQRALADAMAVLERSAPALNSVHEPLNQAQRSDWRMALVLLQEVAAFFASRNWPTLPEQLRQVSAAPTTTTPVRTGTPRTAVAAGALAAPHAIAWPLQKPARPQAYNQALYDLLKEMRDRGEPRPTAAAVLRVWGQHRPAGVVQVTDKGFTYSNASGVEKEVDLDALRKTIDRMTRAGD